MALAVTKPAPEFLYVARQKPTSGQKGRPRRHRLPPKLLDVDEAGLRVAKKLHRLHALALRQQFKRVQIRDGWMPCRALQNKATNLMGRLRGDSDDVWHLVTQANMPLTNNLAEQAVQTPKVEPKVFGHFRTPQGAQICCVIRSYAATLHRRGTSIFSSLVAAFKVAPRQRRFGGVQRMA